jgi:hypothetical protein
MHLATTRIEADYHGAATALLARVGSPSPRYIAGRSEAIDPLGRDL